MKTEINAGGGREKRLDFKCSICGCSLRKSYDWARAENGKVYCGFCYQNLITPHEGAARMEFFG